MLKRIGLFLLLCGLVMGAAAAEGIEFSPLHISLWIDEGVSYEWSCEYTDNGVVDEPLIDYIPGEGGGVLDYYFSVNKSGMAQIIFNYGENWSVSMPEKSIVCTVKVDEEGNNSVRWAESFSDDHMMMIRLPSNPSTGWNWAYQEDTSGMVTLVSQEYEPHDVNLEGAGGSITYLLQLEKPGETVLLFDYCSLWEPESAASETYAVVLTANDDMEFSFYIDEQ